MAVFGARRDRAAGARLGEPEPLEMLLGQRHRRVEADHRELARDMQDRLDDRLAHLGVQIVQLSGVVPGHAGAVVAVVDIARAAVPVLDALEHHRRIGAVVVVVLEVDADAGRSTRGPAR